MSLYVPRLLDVPMVGLYPCPIEEANRLLVEWGHRLGPVNRPFRQEGYVLELDGYPIAVATSGSIISPSVAGYQREEVVELTRLAAAKPWASRVMIRLWREVCGPRWKSWPVKAAISYSHNLMHRGNLYRFDGWEKVTTNAGSGGGGRWSRKRTRDEAVYGPKTLWIWRYERDDGE
jgi:antitoxin VapB